MRSIYAATLTGAMLVLTTLTAGAVGTQAAERDMPTTCRGHQPTIAGTPGEDTIRGTRGADVIVAGAGRDRIDGRGGADIICAGQGWDRLSGGAGRDRLYGDDGADTLSGGPGRDRLYGNDRGAHQARWNVLSGGKGNDHMYGGPASAFDLDHASYARSAKGIRFDGRVVRIDNETDRLHNIGAIVGSPKRDVLRGTTGRDVLYGLGGDDRIYGLDGQDHLNGGAGDDRVLGGAEDDQIEAFSGDDRVRAGPGDDEVGGIVGDDQYDGGKGDDVLRGFGSEVPRYGPLTIRVEAHEATRDGTTGFDRFESYVGGDAADLIVGTSGPDRLSTNLNFPERASARNQRGRLDPAPIDRIHGRGGDDWIGATGRAYGGAGDDRLEVYGTASGGDGKDRVDAETGFGMPGRGLGGGGDDVVRSSGAIFTHEPVSLDGGTGDDTVYANDIALDEFAGLYGGAGHDLVKFRNSQYASDEQRTIDLESETAAEDGVTIGLRGFEDVRGGLLAETIIGDDSDNVLRGGNGEDTVDGRDGHDVCVAEVVMNCED